MTHLMTLIAGALAAATLFSCAAVPNKAHAMKNNPEAERPQMRVTGAGELKVPADQLRLALSVVTEGAQDQPVSAVMEENSRLASRVREALRRVGLEDDEVETSSFMVAPIYSTPQRGEARRITGYRVQNEVRVTTKKMELAGRIIQQGVEAGANQVSSLTFGLAEERAHRADAIAQATRNARSDATALARAAGVNIVRTLRLDLDQPQFQPPQPFMASRMNMEADAGAQPPIEAGEVTVRATVTIIFEIGEGR
ncbi:MAG: DUF541 domain-containing protein [Phycisphaeraceae bacterium]|nr:MAG: DUF541 domain-containing protein [Phycisphaeraceae bacterium]